MPDELEEPFTAAHKAGETLSVAFIGSGALGKDAGGWSMMAAEEIEKAYGGDFLDIDIFEFNGTSMDFVNGEVLPEIAAEAFDVVLLEGFTLEDNGGMIGIQNSLENVNIIIQRLKEQNPELVVVLQPPHPIHGAVNYPDQVEQLKQFAATHNIPYLDHWEAWPDYTSEELLDYLTDDAMPNSRGHELWAGAVAEYFAAR